MARKSFLYYLFSKDKKPLYVDDAGHVQEGDAGNYTKPDGQPARLKNSPDGWSATLIKYARNPVYWGLFRSFSVPMIFVGDGARILRDRMWMFGVDVLLYLGIAKFDRTSLPYTYTSFYVSELDFTKYSQTKNGVQIQAVEGGLIKLLKANENTTYEIPISTDLQKFYVVDDGVVLTNKSNYNFIDQLEIKNGALDAGHGFHAIPFLFMNREAVSSGMTFQTQELKNINGTSYADKLESTNWFARAEIDNNTTITLKIKGQLVIECTEQDAANGLRLRFLRSNLDIANQDDYVVFLQTPLADGNIYRQDVDIEIVLQPGERLYFEGFLGFTGTDTIYQFLVDSKLSITYDSRYKTTYTECLTPSRVLEKIVSQLTKGQYLAQSSFIDAKTDIALTSGNAIRGIRYIDTLVPNKIKTSLADFFKSFGIFSIGLTVQDNKLIIEPMAYFFQNRVTVDLGEVDDAVIDPAEDISFNTVRTGYKEVEYNDVNGKIEFNQGQQWSTPITKVVKELDLRSVYRADPIGMELLRINYEGLNTTDTKNDGDVFMKNIETTSQTFETTVDFVASGVYMTNPDNIPFSAGMRVRFTGSVNNNNEYLVVGTGVNIVQFDPVGPAVIDETGATITIVYVTSGVFKLNRPAYTVMTGIPSAMQSSIYNVELSPNRNLRNNGPMIRSVLDYQDAEKIIFSSADKNAELSTTLAGITIAEKADIQIGGLGDKLFLPYYITLRTKVPVNVVELISADPFGKIQFTYNGTVFSGFLWDGGIAPAKAGRDNDAQTWKLLSAPENDMKKFAA